MKMFSGWILLLGFAFVQANMKPIWTYEPATDVTSVASLDLDLYAIEQLLQGGTDATFKAAEQIYKSGSHGESTALISMTPPSTITILAGTEVVGRTSDDREVKGIVRVSIGQGQSVMLVQYSGNEEGADVAGCYVGANTAPVYDGCFVSAGEMSIPSLEYNFTYSYKPATENINFLTLFNLSIDAKEKMNDCQNCPFIDYQKFLLYYGKFDYADEHIQAAFGSRVTRVITGAMNFAIYSFEGRRELIQKLIVGMSVWMYVIAEMEDAIDDCELGCTETDLTCSSPPGIQAWDRAVALYAGSQLDLPDNKGKMLYDLADQRCGAFKTCGEHGKDTEGTSHVNYEIFKHFIDGKFRLEFKECDLARKAKNKIVSYMIVPLIQGTLRYAHILAEDKDISYNERHGAEGAAYTLSVLPLIHRCSPADAAIILGNMFSRVDPDVDFQQVKEALERNYDCLQISCEEVGGIYDDALGEYKRDAKPCGFHPLSSLSRDQRRAGRSIGYAVLGLVVMGIAACCIGRCSERGIDRNFKPPITDEPRIEMTDSSPDSGGSGGDGDEAQWPTPPKEAVSDPTPAESGGVLS